jgi:hypothetical protein
MRKSIPVEEAFKEWRKDPETRTLERFREGHAHQAAHQLRAREAWTGSAEVTRRG